MMLDRIFFKSWSNDKVAIHCNSETELKQLCKILNRAKITTNTGRRWTYQRCFNCIDFNNGVSNVKSEFIKNNYVILEYNSLFDKKLFINVNSPILSFRTTKHNFIELCNTHHLNVKDYKELDIYNIYSYKGYDLFLAQNDYDDSPYLTDLIYRAEPFTQKEFEYYCKKNNINPADFVKVFKVVE